MLSVYPNRFHQRHPRDILSSVRAHYRSLDRDLGAQLAHAFPRPRFTPPPAARRGEGFFSAHTRRPVGVAL